MFDATLSRRERQIMEALYTLRLAGAREVADHIGEPEAFDSVRVTLIALQKRGLVIAQPEGRRNVYRPARDRQSASADALATLKKVFFGGSTKAALVALLDQGRDDLQAADLEDLEAWVKKQSESAANRGRRA